MKLVTFLNNPFDTIEECPRQFGVGGRDLHYIRSAAVYMPGAESIEEGFNIAGIDAAVAMVESNPKDVYIEHPKWANGVNRRSDEAHEAMNEHVWSRIKNAIGGVYDLMQFGVNVDVDALRRTDEWYDPRDKLSDLASASAIVIPAPDQWTNGRERAFGEGRGYWLRSEYESQFATLVESNRRVIIWHDPTRWGILRRRLAMIAACYHAGVPVDPFVPADSDWQRLLSAQASGDFAEILAVLAAWGS